MSHVKTVTPFVFLAISLKETLANAAAFVASFFASLGTAQNQAAKFEMLNNLTDVELANKYGINRDQVVAYVFNDFRG